VICQYITENKINSSSLNYLTKPIQQTAQKREFQSQRKFNLSGCPTNQVQAQFSFLKPQSKRFFCCAVFLPHDPHSRRCHHGGRGESAREVREPNLHKAPYPKLPCNSHPCRNVTLSKAKIVTSYLFSLSYSRISKKTAS